MTFVTKDWHDGSAGGTPITADALEDMESRVAAYADTVGALKAQGLAATPVKSSAYTASAGDFVPIDASAGSVVITLPNAPADHSRVGVKLVSVSGSFTGSVVCGGSDTYNRTGGGTTLTMSYVNQAAMLQYDATLDVWYVQSTDAPFAALDARYLGASAVAGGVLGGTFPNPSFAVDMATQAELDTEAASRAAADALALAKASNLSDLANAATARTNLGLGTAATAASSAFDAAGAAATAQAAAIAASQPVDSDLTAIAALTTTTFGRALLTQADAAAVRTAIGAAASGGSASSIVNVPAGNIAATDVQTALNELDTEKADASATTTALALKAPLASPALTGTPTVPTAAVDTATTQAASTAYVVAQAAAATPIVDGTGAAGSSTRFARADHVHPTDTSRAALASPTFTGTPAAPTATARTGTTQLATTAYVDSADTTVTANTQTGSYTLVLGDAGKTIEMNSASATVLTIPPNSSVAFPVGTVIEVCRIGAGTVTITDGAGVTIPNRLEAAGTTSRTLTSQYSSASLRKRATDVWVLVGDFS